MKNDLETLLELVIEYFSNTNAAGEYDGNDPRLKDVHAEHVILTMAYKVQQQEQMRNWNL